MARAFKHEKGFLVINLNQEEARYLGFGVSEGCICMQCNNIEKDDIYYIAALNDTMCPKCYNEFVEKAKWYPEDAKIEERNFNYYKTLLNI